MRSYLLVITLLILYTLGCREKKPTPFHPENLARHQWELARYASGIGQTNPIEGSRITLRFQGDTLVGNAGCNDYFASWEYRGHDYIAVSGQIGTTEMHCDGFMKQEALYLNILSQVSTFIVNDTLLQLSGPAGFLAFAPTRPDGAPPEPSRQFLSGYFMAGNEVSIFRDCADTTVVFWLEDETHTLDSLYHAATGGQEYQPVLLEIDALKMPRSNLGYASEYDGVIKVKRIRKIAAPDPRDQCFRRMTWG